jgi:hypothetical protein
MPNRDLGIFRWEIRFNSDENDRSFFGDEQTGACVRMCRRDNLGREPGVSNVVFGERDSGQLMVIMAVIFLPRPPLFPVA